MAKLPWRRKNADAAPPSLETYLSAQPIDYTAMSVDEDEGVAARFQRLPYVARIVLFLVPLLLLGGLGWAVYQFVATPPPETVTAPVVTPEMQLNAARVVNPQEIVVMGITQDIPNGTMVSARVLQDGEPIAWIEPSTSSGTVNNNLVTLRVRKSPTWTQPLTADAAYTIELSADTTPAVAARQELDIPSPLAESFFGEVAVAATADATTQPTEVVVAAATTAPEATAAPAEATSAPTPEPTSAPAPALATLTVGANATLLVSPTLGSDVIATASSGASYQPLLRTPDNQFYLVYEGNRVGWLPASQVTIDPAQVDQIALTTPSQAAIDAGPLRARVYNGGNIRYGPSLRSGTVLGQLHARQTVTIKERTSDGVWYHVVAPEAEGWVHVSLLELSQEVLSQVPSVN